jgi:hypothetical protein
MGTEDGRHQGWPVFSADRKKVFLRFVPREKVSLLLDALFRFYMQNKQQAESLGYFVRRVGTEPILDHLGGQPTVEDLLLKTSATDDYLNQDS